MARRGLLCILAVLIVAPLLPGAPSLVESHQDEHGELHFCILHTNDLHSALIPHSPAVDYQPGVDNDAIGGFARLASAVNEIRENKRQDGEPVLLLDAGDFLGGTPFAWLALQSHAAELTIMQEMGYDAVVIGNHEYDYGPDVLAGYLLQAGYPEAHEKTLVLASNMQAPGDHPLATQGLYRRTGLFELENGLRIGVFGLIGEPAVLVIGDSGEVRFADAFETARGLIDELRASGADVIVAITHSGLDEDRELARRVAGIDIIIGGHCHTALHRPVLEGSTLIAQTGHQGMYLGQLELSYDPAQAGVRLRNENNGRPFLVPIDNSLVPDPDIDAMIQEHTSILNAHVNEMSGGVFDNIMSTIARSDFTLSHQPPLSETPLGNFVTDAMRSVAQEVTGKKVDIAGQANGAIRKSIFPGSAPYSAGNISFYEIAETSSMGYGLDGYAGCPVVSLYITGEEVRRLLEISVLLQEFLGDSFFMQFSGLRYSYNPTNAVLLTIPFIDLPIPTGRAVTRAELFTGDGIQPADGEGYLALRRGDETLYHVVTDAYLILFLPVVTEMLPRLEIVPKNAEGEPVALERIDELIVHHADGRELKIWEAVLIYAAAQEHGLDGIPSIPDYYDAVAGRINRTWSFPFIGWLLLTAAVLVTGTVLIILHRRKRIHASRGPARISMIT
jgi:5'-nucleotidase / UDP-sugar diphosphatase